MACATSSAPSGIIVLLIKTGLGVIHSPIYPMMMDLVVLLNAHSLFGQELGKKTILLPRASTPLF